MATATHTPAPGEMACPDPSAHDHQNKLSAAASTAALYATNPERNKDNPLGSDGRLSSKSAATSLKYANPQDLPSFPSRGGSSSAAGQAALLAKDHKMKDLWEPQMSAAGSKAAILAHKDGGKVDLWQHSPSAAGNSAATLAFKNKSLSPQIDRGYTDVGKNNSLLAATMSTRQSRQRAGSTPVAPAAAYPDSHNSGKNALNAASVSHRKAAPDGWSSEANQAARVKNMHMDREMFGDHPNIGPEAEERKHNAALHASAVSMAKSMMERQNRLSTSQDSETSSLRDLGTAGAGTAHRRNQSSMSQTDIKEEAIKYIHLQDAAHRLAQERLAKVDRDMEQGRYREYYGYPSQSGRQSRFSVRGRGRKRASSEPMSFEDSDDEEQARRIRTQMNQLSTAQSNIDDKQRQEDRARLMAAAEKRVHARMHDMDEKVFQDTGKVSQSMMDEWENKARERAEKDRAERAQHPGKTHIGGGKYMDQAEIEAIAAARLKPTLDELTDTAEKRRARDEEIRVQRDREETARMQEKMQSEQSKAEFKRIREQDKAAARKEKEDRKAAKKAEKEAEKARKNEDKRKSREQKRDAVAAVTGGAALAEVVDSKKEEEEKQRRDREAAGTTLGEALEKSKTEDEKEREGQQKEKAVAGSVLAEALEKSRSEEEKQKEDQVAAGSTLAEVAERVKTNDGDDEEEDEEEERGRSRNIAVVPAAIPVAASEEETAPPQQEVKEEPREVATEQPKDKPERRSMFGSISNRFKRKNKDDKATEEPKKSVEEPAHDDGTAAPVIGLGAAGLAAAGGIEEEHASPEEDTRDIDETANTRDDGAVPQTRLGAAWAAGKEPTVLDEGQARPEAEAEDSDNEGIDRVAMAGAVAGTAALGAIVAAGSVEAEQRRSGSGDMVDEEEHISEVSSLSTDSDLSDSDDDRELQGVTTAPEHSGAYNFAGPSPGLTPGMADRPNIMRHISTIESSSGSEPGSPDLTEDDEEYRDGRLAPRPTMVEDFQQREGVATRDTPLVVSESVPAAVAEDADSPVSPMDKDEEDPVADGEHVTRADARPEDQHVEVVPAVVPSEETNREVAPTESASVAESGAPAPVVKRGPSDEQRNRLQKDKEPEEKKDSGVRGFFRKLKGKSKADNKLQKREPSGTRSESELPTAAAVSKETQPASTAERAEPKDDDFVTPVTTTNAGAEAEGKTVHMGTDGPIGDPEHVSGLGGELRPQSPSSFERGKAESRDLDDVSSSGADEDDVSRGRAGRLAKKLGLKKDSSKAKERATGDEAGVDDSDQIPQSATSNGEEDQFEEARDQFDESLAPPPAFGGQMKSQSPVRETRFQEQL